MCTKSEEGTEIKPPRGASLGRPKKKRILSVECFWEKRLYEGVFLKICLYSQFVKIKVDILTNSIWIMPFHGHGRHAFTYSHILSNTMEWNG